MNTNKFRYSFQCYKKGWLEISREIIYGVDNARKRNIVLGLLFAVGLFLMGGFSLDQLGFHSDLIGILGTFLLIGSYIGFNWSKLKSGDHKTRVVTTWVIILLLLIVILNVIETVLS